MANGVFRTRSLASYRPDRRPDFPPSPARDQRTNVYSPWRPNAGDCWVAFSETTWTVPYVRKRSRRTTAMRRSTVATMMKIDQPLL